MLTNFLVTKKWAIRTESISHIEIFKLNPFIRFCLNNGEKLSYASDNIDRIELFNTKSKEALELLATHVFNVEHVGKIDLDELISQTDDYLKTIRELGYDYDEPNKD